MLKLFRSFIFSAQDTGKYSTAEIADRMKPTENANEESLMDFACAVSAIFEDDPCESSDSNKSERIDKLNTG